MRSSALRVILALSLFLILQEITLRWAFPVAEVSNFHRIDYSPKLFRAGSDLPTTLGHASFTWSSAPDDYEFVHELNLYGFRDSQWNQVAESDITRVLFIGDSFIEGFGTDGENTLPAWFERFAAEEGLDVEVLNLGIGGAGPFSYAPLARDAVAAFQPNAVFVVLYENDVVPLNMKVEFFGDWKGKRLEVEHANLLEPRILHVLGEWSTGQRVPRRWTSPPFRYLGAVPDPRNAWSHPEQVEKLEQVVAPDIAEAMRTGRFNPAFALWNKFENESLNREVDLTDYLELLDVSVREYGADLYLVYIPLKTQISDRYRPFIARFSAIDPESTFTGPEYQRHGRELGENAAELAIPYLDLSAQLREIDAAGPPLYWDYDDHFRPRGYRVAARLILDWWRGGVSEPTTDR
ncbi:SGNH/GDSL hydrolase family protein [Myxococcota bacterium]|nr:SGNH/GDSL hydrolase family protein [Myxococcota bacterium]